MVKVERNASEVQVCSNCGEINYDNVSFCQDCGSMLKEFTHVFCEICGAKNLIENKVCDDCKNIL